MLSFLGWTVALFRTCDWGEDWWYGCDRRCRRNLNLHVCGLYSGLLATDSLFRSCGPCTVHFCTDDGERKNGQQKTVPRSVPNRPFWHVANTKGAGCAYRSPNLYKLGQIGTPTSSPFISRCVRMLDYYGGLPDSWFSADCAQALKQPLYATTSDFLP